MYSDERAPCRQTIGYDPMINKETAASFAVEKMELDEIWPVADYVTVHTPYMPQTQSKWFRFLFEMSRVNERVFFCIDLVGAEALKRCKPSVRIVNVARGGIVDEEALLDALSSGRCHGAALDVFVSEPPKEGSVSWRLIQHPRVICTPHLGASTVEAQERVAREVAEQLIDLMQVSTR